MATYLFGVRLDTPPCNPILLQSNAIDNNNSKHHDGRRIIPRPLLDNFSGSDQEPVNQEPQEKGTTTILSLVLMTSVSYCWTVKKTLKNRDVNGLCRLMLRTTEVHEHVLSKWSKARRSRVTETERGVRVNVLDINTDTTHKLVFKKWRSSGSFVFTGNWVSQFVKRRGLKEGDVVGFRWDSGRSRFLFCVLSLA